MQQSTPISSVLVEKQEDAKPKRNEENQRIKKVNESLFKPSEWDDYPMKRDDKHFNKIIQSDFVPLTDSTKPEPLPANFVFGSIDLTNDAAMSRLCLFLNSNFNSLFELDIKHLKWVLDVPTAPDAKVSHLSVVTVCVASSEKIVGAVCSRPITYKIDGRVIQTREIGWLCTLKELRGKRLASMLMKEMYRRCHLSLIDCGMIFCMTRQLPGLPIVGESNLLVRTFSPGEVKATKNIDLIRFANMRDVSRMMKIYRGYTSAGRWRLHREYTRREFEHCFLRRGDVSTYVIRTERGDVKDFISLTTSYSNGEKKKSAIIRFISFLNDKLLELFMQNVMYVLCSSGYDAVYIEDVNGVGDVCRSKLGFQVSQQRWYYQYNYNSKTVPLDQTQLSSMFY